MRSPLTRLLIGAAIVAASGPACSRASDEGEARPWAKDPPPTKAVAPPSDLAIAVRVDGADRAPITAAALTAAKPDFADAERSAWLIATLVPEAAAAGTTVEAMSPVGVSVKFERPSALGLEPVLFLTRRGEVLVSAIDPKDPFPRYHGQGGRLKRAGDAYPRVSPVARLDVARAR
jgi:hypothetical protein